MLVANRLESWEVVILRLDGMPISLRTNLTFPFSQLAYSIIYISERRDETERKMGVAPSVMAAMAVKVVRDRVPHLAIVALLSKSGPEQLEMKWV